MSKHRSKSVDVLKMSEADDESKLQIVQLRSEVDVYKSKTVLLEDELQAARQKISTLENSDNGFKKAFEESQKEKIELEQALSRMKGKIDATYHLNSIITNKNEDLMMEVSKREDMCTQLKAEHSKTKKKLVRVEKDAVKFFHQNSTLQQQLKAEAQKVKRAANNQKAVEAQLAVEIVKNEELKAKNQELINQLKSTEKRVQEESSHAQELNNQLISANIKLEAEYAESGRLNTKLAEYDHFADHLKESAKMKRKDQKHEVSIELYGTAIDLGLIGQQDKSWIGSCWFGLAVCYHDLNRYDKSLKNIDEAIQRNPHNAIYFYNRACYYEELGKKVKAINDLKQSLRLDPSYKPATIKLSEITNSDKK